MRFSFSLLLTAPAVWPGLPIVSTRALNMAASAGRNGEQEADNWFQFAASVFGWNRVRCASKNFRRKNLLQVD
jgi:hypothetical protein